MNLKNRSRAETQKAEMTENEIGTIVLEAAITVYQELGPVLLESVYEAVLAAYRIQTRLLAEFW